MIWKLIAGLGISAIVLRALLTEGQRMTEKMEQDIRESSDPVKLPTD